jgi:hypothetical protein
MESESVANKLNELHFIDEIIRNMKHLERMYSSGLSEDPKELISIKNALHLWYHKQEKVIYEINILKGYGTYDPSYKVEENTVDIPQETN